MLSFFSNWKFILSVIKWKNNVNIYRMLMLWKKKYRPVFIYSSELLEQAQITKKQEVCI